LWRARITENDLWCPEPTYRQIQEWLDQPPYYLDVKSGVLMAHHERPPSNAHVKIAANSWNVPQDKVCELTTDTASRQLAERKTQVVRIPGDIGAEIRLEWFEFVDREAKSLYYSELLRRKAWEAPQKDE
jgi:hypothetical protein